MIQREYDKGNVSRTVMPESSILEYGQTLAMEDYEGEYAGIAVERAQEFAELIVPDGTTEVEAERLATNLSQLPFFAQGLGSTVRFAQELIEQYFLGAELCRLVDKDLGTFRRRLRSGVLPPDSLSLRMLVSFARTQSKGLAIGSLVQEASLGSHEFRNLLQIALLEGTGSSQLRSGTIAVEYSALNGMLFESNDLTGVSFRGVNLTDCVFRACKLTNASLEEATLMNTTFDGETSAAMQGCAVGSLQRFFSVVTPDGQLNDPKRAAAWFDRVTGVASGFNEPCRAAQQLRHLFGKYVRPDGSPRRDSLDENALTRGTRFADPRAVLEATVSAGYLAVVPPHDRFRRAEGEKYREMVEYVRDQTASPQIRQLLDNLCSKTDCPHIPVQASEV